MGSDARRAVIVGINEYQHAPRLSGCVRDATEVAAVLQMPEYGFDTQLLLDDDASRRDSLDALWTAAESGGRIFIVYFAGHGGIRGGAGYLMTSDGVTRDPGIGLAELAQIMASASENYDHVVTILDACHSGAGSTWIDHRPLSAETVKEAVAVVNSSRLLMAACRPEQVAYEDAEPDVQGAFTRVLLDALAGDAVDFAGHVTAHSLFDVVIKNMDTERQMPVFKGDSAGSVIIGTGFAPRQGAPIPQEEKGAVLAKAERLIDEYQLLQTRELSRLEHRRTTGLHTCAKALTEIVRWFSESERELPDLQRDTEWKTFRHSIANYQSALSSVGVGDVLPLGRVQRHVGGGGFGEVWALENEDGASLAYKVFHGAELTDNIKPRRFRNGYHSMAMLSHPRIVAVRELTEAPLGFTMDLIDGADLRSAHIDRSSADTLLTLAMEIADTIRFAHGAPVVHRDIKPENVILAWDSEIEEYVPHLTDFDLAYIETNRTVTINMVGGVINYAAPEQFYSSTSDISRAVTVDVYGFAQLLFFIYIGSDPSADRPRQNLERFSDAVGSLYTQAPAEMLIELYRRSSAYNPQDRPGDMEEVYASLTAAKIAYDTDSNAQAFTSEAILRQVAFTYAGAGRYEASESGAFMQSRSGTLDIKLEVKGIPRDDTADFQFTLSFTGGFGVPGASSGAQGRLILNQRLDKRMQRFAGVTRIPGTHGIFQTHIRVDGVVLSQEGILKLAEILAAAIAAIEHLD